MRFILFAFLPACVCAIEAAPPTYCERLETVACANAQCDARGEPTPDRCDMTQVEDCVSAIEAAVDCWHAGGVAGSDLCRTACESEAQ